VPTLADSTVSEGLYSTTFRVSALTSTPGVFFDSHPGSGYSLDNLAPGVPQGFAIEYYTGSGNALSWDPAEEPDFQYYRIYRSSSPEFTPSPNGLVQETASPAWTDPEIDEATVYYKITAVDFAGNESEPASAATVTDVPRPTDPERFALHGNVPNPFNPKTVIQYEVPAGGAPIEIVVYDAAGRRVRTLARSRETAGNKQVIWDGRNDEGHLVATGVYFYRMTGGDFVRTRKMLLLK